MPESGNPISLNGRLKSITFQMSTNVDDPAVVRYIRGNLLNIKLLSTLPKSHGRKIRSLRVDTSKGYLNAAYVTRVISDRYQFFERAKKRTKISSATTKPTSLDRVHLDEAVVHQDVPARMGRPT